MTSNKAESRPADKRASDRVRVFFLLVIVIAGWELSAVRGWVDTLFWPAPSAIAAALVEGVLDGTLPTELGVTLVRVLAGLAIGGSAGVGVGLLMGWLPWVRRTLEPLVAMLHPLPKIALLPLLMLVLGIGESSKIATVALSSFFPLLINTLAGVQQIAPVHWEVAQNYGAKRRHVWTRVQIPGSLPMMLTGLRIALNTALIVALAVELVAAQAGLGSLIWLAWQTMRLRHLYAALVVIALLGYGFNCFIDFLSVRLAPWQER